MMKATLQGRQKKILRWLILNVFAVHFFGGNWARSQDAGPDLQKEQKFHNIYSNYNQNPTPVEQWAAVIGKQSQNYTIQGGDTLWDISQTLFNDPHFWPKIWSVNAAQIFNPHEIDIGQNIQFTPGTVEAAPSVEMAAPAAPPGAVAAASGPVPPAVGGETGVTGQVPPSPPTGAVEASLGGPTGEPSPLAEAAPRPQTMESVIPPPRHFSKILKRIPPSLPSYSFSTMPSKSDLIMQLQNHQFKTAEKYLTHFLSEEAIEGVGKVVEMVSDYQTAGVEDFIIVKLNSPPSESKILSVINDSEELPISKEYKENADLAYIVEVQGEIEILGPIEEGGALYRARVRRALNPISINSKVIFGANVKYDFQKTEINSALKGHVIGGREGTSRQMMSVDEIIYLGAGRDSNLQNGDSVVIYKNEVLRKFINDDTLVKGSFLPIAIAKVIRVTEHFATAVIVSANEGVLVGDFLAKNKY